MDASLGAGGLFNRPNPAQLLRQNSKSRSGRSHDSGKPKSQVEGQASQKIQETKIENSQPELVTSVDRNDPQPQPQTLAQIDVSQKPPTLIRRNSTNVSTQPSQPQQPTEAIKPLQDMADMLQIGKVRFPCAIVITKQTNQPMGAPDRLTFAPTSPLHSQLYAIF